MATTGRTKRMIGMIRMNKRAQEDEAEEKDEERRGAKMNCVGKIGNMKRWMDNERL